MSPGLRYFQDKDPGIPEISCHPKFGHSRQFLKEPEKRGAARGFSVLPDQPVHLFT